MRATKLAAILLCLGVLLGTGDERGWAYDDDDDDDYDHEAADSAYLPRDLGMAEFFRQQARLRDSAERVQAEHAHRQWDDHRCRPGSKVCE